VVTAPGESSPRPTPAISSTRSARPWLSPDLLLGAAAAVAFSAVAFACTGGIDLAPNTWVQVGLVVLGAAAAVAVVLVGARGPAWGGLTLGLFAALAALTYASIAWSVQPATSWLEANRTLSYLAAFGAAAALARIAPERWRPLLGGVAAASVIVCAYALLVKVFPGSLDPVDPYGRLQAPFDYWNAVGLMAALGLPPCLWAGARQEPGPFLRALSVPALAVLITALVLCYSRAAVVVAVVGVGTWFAFAPLRLRSALILALGAAAGGAMAAWGLATRGISADHVALATRTSAGHNFGVVIIVVLCLATAAGFAAAFALDRVVLPARIRRGVGAGLIGVVAVIPVAGVVALAASSRGLTGEVSHVWNTLTNPNGVVGDQPGRLVQLSNSRAHYWSIGLKVGEHHLLAGAGALGFATAGERYPGPGVWSNQFHTHVGHAHSYLVETFADFGLIGVAISLALLVAWTLATARTFELSWPRRSLPARGPPPGAGAPPSTDAGRARTAARTVDAGAAWTVDAGVPPTKWTAERVGLIAVLATVFTFGVHSLVDWTWFIPGTAVPALACAGWLAGRGPLRSPVGRLPARRSPTRSLGTAAGVTVIVLIAVLAVWVIVQPLRSSDAYSAAITAAVRGNGRAALTDARSAAAENPVSVDPLFLLARLYADAGDPVAARSQLVDAVSRQPSNPQSWQELGCFDLQHRTGPATSELHRGLVLEPSQTEIQTDPGTFCAGAD
jgi:hypothetical protein